MYYGGGLRYQESSCSEEIDNGRKASLMTEGYQSLQVEGRITRQGNGPRAGVQSLESQLESKDRDGEVGR